MGLTQAVVHIYRLLLARKRFYKLNKFLFSLALRGMGILNYENDRATGEDHFLRHSFPRFVADENEVVVFDVGANEGRYASKVMEIYPNGEVYAFEPHPDSFRRLELRGATEGFRAINLACGKSSGEMKLYDYLEAEVKGTQHASLYEDVIDQIHRHKSAVWDVRVVDLDHFIEERGIEKVHLLKVDTEGHDLSVVLGGLGSITNGIIDVIQFEFNEMNVVSRAFFKDFYDLLPEYVFFRLLPDGVVPLGRYTPLTCELFAYQNVVAVPQRCFRAPR